MSSIYKNGTMFGTTEASNITTTVGSKQLNLENVIQDVLGDFATIESNPSTRAYTEGQFLTVDGKLYKVTEDIAVGDTLSTTTNLERTTAGVELDELNRQLVNAVVDIERTGTTFTMTKVDGSTDTFTQQDNNTTYEAGTYLTLNANNVFSHNNSGVTAASKGDTNAQTPKFGGTFKALSGTVDAQGHLTNFNEHTVTIPNTAATTSAAGLMSATDKTKLNSMNNVGTLTYTVVSTW